MRTETTQITIALIVSKDDDKIRLGCSSQMRCSGQTGREYDRGKDQTRTYAVAQMGSSQTVRSSQKGSCGLTCHAGSVPLEQVAGDRNDRKSLATRASTFTSANARKPDTDATALPKDGIWPRRLSRQPAAKTACVDQRRVFVCSVVRRSVRQEFPARSATVRRPSVEHQALGISPQTVHGRCPSDA